jgi:hypothetical protein
VGFAELAEAGRGEEGREAEDVLVGGKETLFAADDDGDYWGGEGAVGCAEYASAMDSSDPNKISLSS